MSALTRHRPALLGLVLLLVLVLLMALSVLTYRKDLPWQRAVSVELITSQPGLELSGGSDVKLQGRRVGRVDTITTDGRVATIQLAIDPEEVARVPAVVDAAIVPKTLFGEKYVDLLVPDTAADGGTEAGEAIADGAVIRQSSTAVELGRIYDRLVPLLRSVDPAQLSLVLSGLARTLDGKGEQIGQVISQSHAFLGDLEPHLGALQRDIRLLGETLRGYRDAAPDLLTVLAETSTISAELLVPSEARLRELLDTLASTSDIATEVVDSVDGQIVEVTGRARPVLAVLDEYSGILPCSLRGLHRLDKLGNQVTGARGPFTLLSVDLLVQGDPYVHPRDLPTNPSSEAHNSNLPSLVPDWRPHCPRFGTQARQVEDAAPFSLEPYPGQATRGDESRRQR